MNPKPAFAPALLGSVAGWFALICTAGAVMAGAGLELPPTPEQRAELELRVTDLQTGEALASRIRIAKVGSLEARRVVVAADGKLTLQLAPGDYRIWASHGPEYTVAQRRSLLGAGERRVLSLPLERQVLGTRYAACDLHVHTDSSHDSQVGLQARLASAVAEGLQVAVITDHNRAPTLDTLPEAPGTIFVPGVEITTWDPEFGHFNTFPSASAPAYKHGSPEKLLASLPPKNARFVQVNHPRLMRHIGYFELMGKRGVLHAMRHAFDGLEVWNGYDLHRDADRDRVLADWLALIEHGKHVVATGGSDSHDLARTVVGYPRTYVELPPGVRPDGLQLAAALRAGRAAVSNGPLLELSVSGSVPGDTLSLARGTATVPAHVRVDAPDWMDLKTVELWVDGHRISTRVIPPVVLNEQRTHLARAELDFEVPVAKAHSILAMVRGERPMDELFDRREIRPFAFTNPVWLSHR